jgi:hypothetical protein
MIDDCEYARREKGVGRDEKGEETKGTEYEIDGVIDKANEYVVNDNIIIGSTRLVDECK